MRPRKKFRFALLAVTCLYFMTAVTLFSSAETRPSAKGHKVKITGPIVVHDGDVLQIRDGRDGSAYSFRVTDKTTIRCDKGFLRGSAVMDASALVPALTVEIEGKGSSQEITEAKTIRFSPDPFVPAASHDQQIADLCHQPAYDPGRSHGVRTLFSSLNPM